MIRPLLLMLLLSASAFAEEGVLLPPTHIVSAGPSAKADIPIRWGTSKKLVLFAITGQVLDLVTTHLAKVDGHRATGTELNPLMKNRWVRYATKSFLITASIGMAEDQQMMLPRPMRVPQWRAEGWLKTIGWLGVVPASANIVGLYAN